MVLPNNPRSKKRTLINALVYLVCILLMQSCQSKADAQIKIQGRAFQKEGLPFHLMGINYYPQKTPWSLFWQNFDPTQTQQDLQQIHKLNFNTVRIFVPYTLFGADQVKPEYANKLKQFLDLIEQNNLHCIVTLFDFYTDYKDTESAKKHLKTLTQGLESHPAILAWDLKNEGDLDYAEHPEYVIHWIREMSETLRRIPVKHLLTAGWSRPENVSDIAPYLDYLTFHYYRPEEDLPELIDSLQKQSQKPLVLGEFGYHTWSQSPQDPHPEAHQFNYYQSILFSVLQSKLAGAMAWTLYDFAPNLKEDWVLQQTSVQHYLGLLDQNQHAKPGLKALQQAIYLRDAQSLKAINLETREIEMVFRANKKAQAHLHIEHLGKQKAFLTLDVTPGINQWHWSVGPEEIKRFIYLQQHYILHCNAVLGPAGERLSQQVFPLILRQD